MSVALRSCVCVFVLVASSCDRRPPRPPTSEGSGATEAMAPERNPPAEPLYFDADGPSIRLTAHAERQVPQLARLLERTTIVSASETVEFARHIGPVHSLDITTADELDPTEAQALAGRGPVAHVTVERAAITLAMTQTPDPAAVSAAMLRHCTDELPNLVVRWARRQLVADGERLTIQADSDARPVVLAWARTRGVPILESGAESARRTGVPTADASLWTEWTRTVSDLGGFGVSLDCSRRRRPDHGV